MKRGPAVATPDDRPPWLRGPTLAVFGILGAIIVVVMVYVAQDAPNRDVARHQPPAAAVPEESPRTSSPPAPKRPQPPPRAPDRATPKPAPPVSRPEDDVEPRQEPSRREPGDPSPDVATSPPQPGRPDDSLVQDSPTPDPASAEPSVEVPPEGTPVASVGEEAVEAAAPTEAPSSTAAPGRPAIPDKATVAAKTKEIRQLFKAEYATRDPAARAAFAKRLARDALTTVDDPVAAWVLATEARDQAIQAGDYETYVELGHFLGDSYGVDTHDDDSVAFGKLPINASVPPTWYRGLLAEITSRVEAMCDRDDFERATKYASVAKAIATRASDTSAAQEWTVRIKELGTLKVQFGGHKAAKEALQANPEDKAASTKWGTYLCLIKGNFEDGLPYLAKGEDAVLAALAKRETNSGRDAMETVAIADEWYTIGERSKAFRPSAWRHAAMLYESAGPELTGLAATKIEKRLEEMADAAAPRSPAATSLDQVLIAQPWNVQWEHAVRHHGRPTPENEPEWSREETITFHPGGAVDSRYFDRFEIVNNVIELHVPEGGDQPPFGGGPPGRFRDLRRHGRAILVEGQLRLIYGAMDRMDDPRNRGVGTRQQAE